MPRTLDVAFTLFTERNMIVRSLGVLVSADWPVQKFWFWICGSDTVALELQAPAESTLDEFRLKLCGAGGGKGDNGASGTGMLQWTDVSPHPRSDYCTTGAGSPSGVVTRPRTAARMLWYRIWHTTSLSCMLVSSEAVLRSANICLI